jgi:glycerol-1-phosphate dehydrogenase [NAD(P)+]
MNQPRYHIARFTIHKLESCLVFHAATESLIRKHLPRVPKLIAEDNLRRDLDELVADVFAPMRLAVVDDKYTADALGDEVFRALKGRFPSTHVTLPPTVIPDDKTVASLRAQTLSADALVAVGSGTINDICKYVAHLDRKPYLVFASAASMNGYVSANASITVGGHKKTMLAMMPQAVFCDLSVITAAPPRLAQSGFGDSAARSTAQADWLLSHLLLDTHYDEVPFELLAPYEAELLDRARGIGKQDKASLLLLIKTLLLSGMGMTIAGGSYPASQGEHMIAHTMEMLADKKAKHPLHGEAIGVTTLIMAGVQQKLLQGKISFRPDDFSTERMIHHFGSEVAMQCRKVFDGKMALVKTTARPEWASVAEKIAPITIEPDILRKALESAGAPTQTSQLGWSDPDVANALSLARYTRERFTFLDLLAN